MKLLTNQIKLDKGSIINGEPLVFNFKINSSIGCLLEKPSLYPYLTAHQHLLLFNILNSENSDSFVNEIMDAY